MNKTYSFYFRYGSYYLHTMRSIDLLYPGLKDMLKANCLSVQAQDRYPVRIATDQRGEQTINKDAKLTGGIKGFADKVESVTKWALNRAEQATITRVLEDMCGITTQTEMYKPCRQSQIINSEQQVTAVFNTQSVEYLNPFDVNLDKTKLLNLSSGSPIAEDIEEILLNLPKKGKELAEQFQKELLLSSKISFHAPIKRNINKSLITTKMNVQNRQKSKKIDSTYINRNILSTLVSYSVKSGKAIDFTEALKFPLSPVPLSLCHGDGTKRKNKKSDLIGIILNYQTEEVHPKVENKSCVYILDLMANIRQIKDVPSTFEELAWRILKSVPRGYSRVDIVADSYLDVSIKSSERNQRGESNKVIIKSAYMKIPREFHNFLANGENKTRLVEVVFDVYQNDRLKALDCLNTKRLVLSTEGFCNLLTEAEIVEMDDLRSNQEEADTRVKH